MGSRRDARAAGNHTAARATALSTSGTVRNTAGSQLLTPKREAGDEPRQSEGGAHAERHSHQRQGEAGIVLKHAQRMPEAGKKVVQENTSE